MSEFNLQCPLPISQHDTIQLGHGSGGKMMNDLIARLFLWAFENPYLNKRDDQAVVEINGVRLAVSTDSFVVDPIFFPGGDIGELAVYGTVNDVCMSGGRPLFLAASVILEEGFPLADLRRVVESMAAAARRTGVMIVTGDTKVVNKGKGDKIFINTTGIGVVEHPWQISAGLIRPGDLVLLSGSLGDHGIAILSRREGLAFETPVTSDTAPLHELVAAVVQAGGEAVHALRDPTRGGLAATLNEFAATAQVGIRIREDRIPLKPAVAGACEILGLDPLYVANEGKLVAVVAAARAQEVLRVMRAHPLGREAALIGEVVADRPGLVTMQTRLGSWRMVDMLVGEQLPRIC
ncbi:MAG: hydrogenase expression/formation protein HypE [candidate division KSB1 bacterium]|nr:hydrogenase expression/formation protein HypE [candidate division KSB1 bacterium]MDZ7274108.1 hydrogenase expression/formation protein HypE [candidate division KSB1 bacterium]MDZ7287848.1 hydrogenase expression/formation protein HypE [candidate division KSB1 bacterium]MDZ7296706.1 hydrogenase expression/formation protein HypE [candidate division KSB1 bacterium]MDZ7309597.1 hydrogenase expression/formation protein HypE [candidate division KSB1 bacterium]